MTAATSDAAALHEEPLEPLAYEPVAQAALHALTDVAAVAAE